MKKITKISVQTKNKERCNIYLDNEFAFSVSMETVYNKRLKKDMDLSDNDILELTLEGEKSKALSKVIDYVSRGLKTKKQVKDNLIKKGYSNNVVFYCIDWLTKYNYINDIEYAKKYIELNKKTSGKKLLMYKLMAKGIKKEDIEVAFNDMEPFDNDSAVYVSTKYMKAKEITKENLAKLYRYLLGKGFSYSQIEYAIDTIKKGESD